MRRECASHADVYQPGSVIHSSTSCELEVNRRLGRAWSAMNSLDAGVWRCRYLCKKTKVRVFRSLVLPVLLYSCETWTLTGELRRRLNSFGAMSLRRILGIVQERQLRLHAQVARLSAEDPAHRILSYQDSRAWTMPRGRPHAWLRQMESYLKIQEWRAWRLPGRWPDGGQGSTVARWTRRRAAPAYAPPYLT